MKVKRVKYKASFTEQQRLVGAVGSRIVGLTTRLHNASGDVTTESGSRQVTTIQDLGITLVTNLDGKIVEADSLAIRHLLLANMLQLARRETLDAHGHLHVTLLVLQLLALDLRDDSHANLRSTRQTQLGTSTARLGGRLGLGQTLARRVAARRRGRGLNVGLLRLGLTRHGWLGGFEVSCVFKRLSNYETLNFWGRAHCTVPMTPCLARLNPFSSPRSFSHRHPISSNQL